MNQTIREKDNCQEASGHHKDDESQVMITTASGASRI
jgi:hypothetical protein